MKQSIVYETVSGQRIEYPEPSAELAQFLRRVQAIAEDPSASEGELVLLIYGAENPIMEKTLFPGRGAVTREVLEDPVYRVMSDLLYRKRIAARGVTTEQIAKAYTLTVTEAAEQLGIHETAVRKAITGRRLPAWVKEGRYYLDPGTFYLLGETGQRGPLPADTQPLQVRVGHSDGVKLAVKAPGDAAPKPHAGHHDGKIERWRRVAVVTGRGGQFRLFVLEPAAEDAEIVFHDFFVKGRFKIVSKENNAARAREAWAAFRAA